MGSRLVGTGHHNSCLWTDNAQFGSNSPTVQFRLPGKLECISVLLGRFGIVLSACGLFQRGSRFVGDPFQAEGIRLLSDLLDFH